MIVLIGLPKSGTSSFHTLFGMLGMKSVHWKCEKGFVGKIIQKNKQQHNPLLHDLDMYDCISQMDVCVSPQNAYWPQVVDYAQLYFENPNALFILNKRNPESLLSSFKRWNDLDKRLYTYNPELVQSKTDAGFIEFVSQHYHNVETFFNMHKDAKFITYDIENDTIDKLKDYIDLKDVKIMPKENVNKRVNKLTNIRVTNNITTIRRL